MAPNEEADGDALMADSAAALAARRRLGEHFVELESTPFEEGRRLRFLEFLQGDYLRGQAAWRRLSVASVPMHERADQ